MKRTRGEKVFNVFNMVFLTIMAITTLYPFIYTLSISLSSAAEVAKGGLHLYPKGINFTSYQAVFRNSDLFVAYANTIFRTVAGTIISLLVCCWYGYALSRPELPHKKFYTTFLVFTMLFNGGAVPTYLALQKYGLIDNRLVYILPTIMSAYNIIVARSFFVSIPNSLNESAKIDGANEFTIFFKIIVPLSLPIIMTLALFIAVMHWSSWYDALMYITSNDKIVVQLLLQRIVQQNDVTQLNQQMLNPDQAKFTSETVKSATIIVAMLPILVFYPFIQKYFTKGVMLGAIKG